MLGGVIAFFSLRSIRSSQFQHCVPNSDQGRGEGNEMRAGGANTNCGFVRALTMNSHGRGVVDVDVNMQAGRY